MFYTPTANREDYSSQNHIWAPSYENMSSGGFRPGKTRTGLLSYRDLLESWNFLRNILPRQQTTKALIRLCKCAGWSASLLFACGTNSFLMTWLIYGASVNLRMTEGHLFIDLSWVKKTSILTCNDMIRSANWPHVCFHCREMCMI